MITPLAVEWLLQATTPADLSLWVPALIQLGGFGLLLWLYYSGKIVNEVDSDQRVKDNEAQFNARLSELTAQYEARLKVVQAYSDKWEAIAGDRDRQFIELKQQLDTATKALVLLADERGGKK